MELALKIILTLMALGSAFGLYRLIGAYILLRREKKCPATASPSTSKAKSK